MTIDQTDYEIRFEWGLRGMAVLGPVCEVIVLVDVLSFSTCVDVAVSRGIRVYPFSGSEEGAAEFARTIDAIAASRSRSRDLPSLSPASLQGLRPGSRLVLASLNGARLSGENLTTPLFTGCLRNARAVAEEASGTGVRIGVVAAGERWADDGGLRPSLEDMLGAGAIIQYLPGAKSPEARAAMAVFKEFAGNPLEVLRGCSSGRELIEIGFGEDVRIAAEFNGSEAAPFRDDQAYLDKRASLPGKPSKTSA